MNRTTKFQWIELLFGILFIALGLFTLINPESTLKSIVILYGIFAILTGIADIALYVKINSKTGFGPGLSLVTGILSILAGILLLFNPAAGTWIFSILFPIWFIAHSISRLANLSFSRLLYGNAYFYFSLILNILALIFGFMLIFNPLASALTISYIIGFYLILAGINSITLAFIR